MKEQLAAYNLESSPDGSAAMETEVPQVPAAKKKEPSRRAATQKKPLASLTEISDDDEDDKYFEVKRSSCPGCKKEGKKKTSCICQGSSG